MINIFFFSLIIVIITTPSFSSMINLLGRSRLFWGATICLTGMLFCDSSAFLSPLQAESSQSHNLFSEAVFEQTWTLIDICMGSYMCIQNRINLQSFFWLRFTQFTITYPRSLPYLSVAGLCMIFLQDECTFLIQ